MEDTNKQEVQKPLSEMSNAELFALGNAKPKEIETVEKPDEQKADESQASKQEETNPLSGILGGRFKTSEEIEAEFTALQEKANKPDVEIPEIDEDLYRLNILKTKTPEEVTGMVSVLYGNPDNVELLVADLMQSNAYYKDKPDEAKEEIMQRYEDAFMEIDEDDEDATILTKQKNRAIRNLQADAMTAKEKRISKFREIEVPKKAEKKVELTPEQKTEELVKVWKPTFDKLKQEGINSISVVEGFDYKLTEAEQKKVLEIAANFVFSGSIQHSEEAYNVLKRTVENYYLLQNTEAVLKSYAEQILTKANESNLETVHNPNRIAYTSKKDSDGATALEKNKKEEERFRNRIL